MERTRQLFRRFPPKLLDLALCTCKSLFADDYPRKVEFACTPGAAKLSFFLAYLPVVTSPLSVVVTIAKTTFPMPTFFSWKKNVRQM